MYYPDLVPYNTNEYNSLGTVRVGWLDSHYSFAQAQMPQEFHARLFQFCQHSILHMRGYHECEFCEPPQAGMLQEARNGVALWLGNAEIRVVGQDKLYAAPTLIYHYVIRHQYAPPDEFVTAVLRSPLPGSTAYDKMIDSVLATYGHKPRNVSKRHL